MVTQYTIRTSKGGLTLISLGDQLYSEMMNRNRIRKDTNQTSGTSIKFFDAAKWLLVNVLYFLKSILKLSKISEITYVKEGMV